MASRKRRLRRDAALPTKTELPGSGGSPTSSGHVIGEIAQVAALAAGVSSISGAIYLSLYWGHFNVDVFAITGLHGILQAASKFVLWGSFLAAGFAVLALIFKPVRADLSRRGRVVVLTIAVLVAWGALFWDYFNYSCDALSHKLVPAIAALVLGFLTVRVEGGIQFLRSPPVRAFVVAWLVAAPGLAIIGAASDIRQLYCDKYQYILASDLQHPESVSEPFLVYLGRLGDAMYFSSPDWKQTYFFQHSDLKIPRLLSHIIVAPRSKD